ncbi:hypothetical protein BDR22DRAFT_885642 [Usnea florida]
MYSTAAQQGLGQDLQTVSEDQIENYMKGMFVSEAGWASTIFIVKSSILAFYWRLFNAKGRAFRFSIWAFLVLTVCWGIAVVVAPVFQCSPFHHYLWQITCEARCLDKTYWFYVGSSIPHIITDIALIGLPMFLVWDLQMSRAQKATLSAIFGLGGFVAIVAFVRLVYLIRSTANSAGLTTNIANILIWTGVETNMSIICACLPSLRPITSYISDKLKLRKHTNTPKRDLRLLVTRSSAVITVLPLFKTQNRDHGRHSNSHSSAETEVEAKAPESPKETECSKLSTQSSRYSKRNLQEAAADIRG